MKRRFNRTQRNYIIVGLCAILVIMGVGYAAFSSQLKISGTSSISSSWNIQITNIETMLPSDYGSEYPDGYNISEPTYTPTSATFNAGFELPGSIIGYIVEVSNLGSIDGQVTIGNLSCGDNSAILCMVDAYDKNPMQEEPNNSFSFNNGNQDYSDINFALKTGEKHYIVVMVGYDDVTEQPTDLNTNIKLDLTYEQAGGNSAGSIPTGETTTIGGRQEVDIVSGGDGLYKDKYESGRYVYKGADPNNYIEFNGELWRIISKEADGALKIVRNESIGNMAWDATNSNKWIRNATLNSYLNETYDLSIFDYPGNGCCGGGNYVTDTNFNKNNFNIGSISADESLSSIIANEKGTLWDGTVSLITVSDYLRANTNIEQCETINLNNTNYNTCGTTNWLSSYNGVFWTVTSMTGNDTSSFVIDSSGKIVNSNANNTFGVRPVVELDLNIRLDGSGTKTNPYKGDGVLCSC